MKTTRPTKVNCIDRLLAAGVNFDAIIDVGVKEQTSELRIGFPKFKHFLFEPVEEFYPAIRQNYADVDYELVEVAASDQDGSADLTVRAISGNQISHSSLVGDKSIGTNRAVRTVRLDTFFRDEMYGDLLLKIDVDGAELKVLAGATGILSRVSCIVIEASRTSFYQRSKFLFEAGFELFDIVDLCYYHGTFHQCDLIFLRTEHFKSPRVNGWLNSGFVSNQWVSLDEGASVWKSGASSLSVTPPNIAHSGANLEVFDNLQLGAVVVPTLAVEVPQLIANMNLWSREQFIPFEAPPIARPKLIFVFNNRTAESHSDELHATFIRKKLDRFFSFLDIRFLELSGDNDVYIKDYSKDAGAQGYKAGPNNQFFQTMRLVESDGPFIFLMESDCVPIRRNWLSRLENLVRKAERFWILGSHYRGAGTIDDQFRRHINGNAVYAVGDSEFQEFVATFWEPRLRSQVTSLDKRIAYDCALEFAFSQSWRTDPEAWLKWKQVAHLFRFTTYIQNISAAIDTNQPAKFLASDVMHEDPDTYIIHNKRLAERFASLGAQGIRFTADSVEL